MIIPNGLRSPKPMVDVGERSGKHVWPAGHYVISDKRAALRYARELADDGYCVVVHDKVTVIRLFNATLREARQFAQTINRLEVK